MCGTFKSTKQGPHQLSPYYGVSWGRGWRRRPTDMERSCEYVQQTVADSLQ